MERTAPSKGVNRLRRIWPLLLLLVFTTAAAIGPAYFTRLSRSSLGAYQTALQSSPPRLPLPGTADPNMQPEAPALSEQVLVIVLSGLRRDTAWRLASVHYVAERGLAVPVTASVPTYGPANWYSLFAGADPAAVGHAGGRGPTVLDLAAAAGIDVAIAGSEPFQAALAPATATALPLPDGGPAAALAAVTEHWYAAHPGLLVAQIDWLDGPGHEFGPHSRDYLQRVGELDAALIRFLRTFDLDRATLLIVGDHGQTANGRHGGDEPDARRTLWVMAGPGIDASWQPADAQTMPQAGFAAVLSGLLGLPLPERATTAAGQELLALVPAGEAAAIGRWQTAAAHLAAWLQAAAPESAADGAASQPAASHVPAPASSAQGRLLHAELEADLQAALAAHARAQQLRRLPFAAGAAIVLLAMLTLLLLSPARQLLLIGLALYVGIALAIWLGPWQFGPFYAPHSGSLSWSSLPAHSDWSGYFRQRAFEASLVLALTATVTGWLTASVRSWEARRNKRVLMPPPVAFGLYLSAGAVAALGLVWLAVYTWIGHDYAVAPPPPRLWHALQLVAVYVQAAGFGAVAWAALAGIGGTFYLRYVPSQAEKPRIRDAALPGARSAPESDARSRRDGSAPGRVISLKDARTRDRAGPRPRRRSAPSEDGP